MDRRGFLKTSLGAAAWLAGGCADPGVRRPRPAAGEDPLARLDALAQAELVRSGEATAGELIQAAMRRHASLPALNAVVTTSFDRALARAARSLAGPFAGAPYLLKDLTDYEGVRCTQGSRLSLERVSQRTEPFVAEVEAAGLVVLGKTNTPEFGLLPSTEGLALGAARNPWSLGHSTGGSSGGAAAAVAAGVVPVAEASDAGGSIRIPASCCGVFGLKPSRGRMLADADGAPGSLEAHHCVSRSVRDSAWLLAATERRDGGAPWAPVGVVHAPSARRLRIAWSTRSTLGEEPDPEVRAATEAAALLCAELGHTVVEAAPALSGEAFVEHFMTLWGHGPALLVEQLEAEGAGAAALALLEPWTLGLAEEYRGKPLGSLAAASRHFAEVARTVDAFFAEADVWLTPVVASPPPALGELAPDVPYATLRERCIRYVAYTPVHNVAGTPAMSVPLAWSAAGLPIGAQFAARAGDEPTLLALAYELEAARPWRERWPALAAAGGSG
jgi:amidase